MADGGTLMTAEEGGDRVAERPWERPDPETDSPGYHCESCGLDEFVLVSMSDQQQLVTRELGCSCGKTDVAAREEVQVTRAVTNTGSLDDEHRVTEDRNNDEVEEVDSEPQERETSCHDCIDEATPNDWISETDDWETVDGSERYELRCVHCGHEIEFGWSHPDRGGRIWPVECADFDPWQSWPEPRFVPAWNRRGWLRPT